MFSRFYRVRYLLIILSFLILPIGYSQPVIDPNRPIKMVIPWPPGGGNDSLGRGFAVLLAEKLGQKIVIENKGGANGIIGAEAVARSAPDGYTIMFHSMTSHATNAVMGIKLPYDTVKDFAPISQVASLDLILVAHPSFPAKNVQELIALAKTKPGSISYASFGNGSMAHIAGELLNQKAGIKMEHIPYKGGAPALADNLAGHVPLYFAGLGVALPHIQAGSLRAIAVTGNNRNPQLPNVPKIAETTGLSDYEANIFYGMWAPAGTPEAIIQRLNRATLEITASAAYKKKIEADGFAETIGSSPEKMANTIKAEMEILAKVIKEAKIQL